MLVMSVCLKRSTFGKRAMSTLPACKQQGCHRSCLPLRSLPPHSLMWFWSSSRLLTFSVSLFEIYLHGESVTGSSQSSPLAMLLFSLKCYRASHCPATPYCLFHFHQSCQASFQLHVRVSVVTRRSICDVVMLVLMFAFSLLSAYAIGDHGMGTMIRLFMLWMSGTVLWTVSPQPVTLQLCSRRERRSSRSANCHRWWTSLRAPIWTNQAATLVSSYFTTSSECLYIPPTPSMTSRRAARPFCQCVSHSSRLPG